ncbi:segregation/condensation protein A [Bacillus sp. H-16]|uniref:segregation/condensation protein A n=1 Tax=Alteribacter salitolerans TaxID=2912333 RepID=UPI001962B93C|nr:segregation/condensation protein A [Alteribacter salitolerans]MBM7094725.1 segregation/condensation protein A [Alteribacter salitolerans]
MQYSVKLNTFEGPLDLLLHLIQKNDLDLYDIPVAKITDQYMNFIHTMQVLQLDIASEYLVMASSLLEMKSKLLLPPKEEDEIYEEEYYMEGDDDPRDDLMKRLIEYKRYKEAAGELKEKEIERSQLFSKPAADLSPLLEEEEKEPANVDVSLYDMLSAFQKLVKRKKDSKPVYSKVHRDEIPIEKRMTEIITRLESMRGKTSFSSLFDTDSRSQKVVTFLAVLELMKSKMIGCTQEGNFNDIVVYQREVLTIDE